MFLFTLNISPKSLHKNLFMEDCLLKPALALGCKHPPSVILQLKTAKFHSIRVCILKKNLQPMNSKVAYIQPYYS